MHNEAVSLILDQLEACQVQTNELTEEIQRLDQQSNKALGRIERLKTLMTAYQQALAVLRVNVPAARR